MPPRPSRFVVRKRFAAPELAQRRKRTIHTLLKRNPELFESQYYRLRHKYQAMFARMILDLLGSNIEITRDAKLEERIRKKSLHVQLKISGIKTKGEVDWQRAQKIVQHAAEDLLGLKLELEHFLRVVESQRPSGVRLSDFPSDLPKDLEAIVAFVSLKGQTNIRRGKF